MRRVSLLVALAVVAGGCTPQLASRPMPKRTGPIEKAVSKPIAYSDSTSKVKVMTQAFSASQNEGLKKATVSLSKLTQSLSSAFRFGAGASASPEAMLRALKVEGMRAAYEVAGVYEQGGATFTYDDETHELTGIRSAEAEVAFAFDDQGATRSFTATILRSPDGSTGSLKTTITGTWREFASFTPVAPPRTHTPVFDSEGRPMVDATEAISPASPPPFKIFKNEVPEAIESVSFELHVAPRGVAAEAVSLSGTLDEPGAVPNSSARMPLHWKLRANVPSVTLDWESRLQLASGASKIEARGELLAAVENGEERFVYELEASEAARAGTFQLTNVGAQLKLVVSATQSHPSRAPEFKNTLVSTVDGSHVGTVVPDPQRPRFAVITLADGTKVDWELYPADLNLAPFGPPPAI